MNRHARFEIREKDLAARIGRFELNGKKAETPLLLPVYHPQKPVVRVEELTDTFKAPGLMTNAYILLKDDALKHQATKRGIHDFLGFDGLIATDSGSFQLMAYGAVATTNEEILAFEASIGTDIGSFLDIPSLPDAFKPRAEEQMVETLKRAKDAVDAPFQVNAGIQGARYLDLRKQCAETLAPDFQLLAAGGIVRLMEDYRFAELVDVLATIRKNLPADRLLHAFGLGHPMIFGLAAALGCDLFDSAAYALFAQEGRYLTASGTKRLADLDYLPCSCPVCTRHGADMKNLPKDERVAELARHNLYVSYAEMAAVKQAIREGSLWELVARRCRSHPALMAALARLEDHQDYLAERDPITKDSALYHTGAETAYRPEVVNATSRIPRVTAPTCMIELPYFGAVPADIMNLYPFGSAFLPDEDDRLEANVRDLAAVRAIADYQFGPGAGDLIPEKTRIKKSRKTKRIRWLYLDKELIASVRASDHVLLPKEWLAAKLLETFPKPALRVVVDSSDPDVIACVKEGKSVFAKFVADVDADLRCGDECLVVDENDTLLKIGTLQLSPAEIRDFDYGMAVRVR